MGRAIIPIRDLTQRPVELGRIRIGAKTEKAMRALDSFRFTSSDRTALDQVAGHYGGTVKPWSDPKAAEGQFEVITTVSEIRIALPEDPLGGTPMYELYGGGGRERWCDGEQCTIFTKGPDGPEPSEVACYCAAAGELECRPTVHLSVILPDVRGIGTWRLTTHSWNAAQEMPAMVALIHSLQGKGIQRGVLRIERKRSVQAGQTRKFPVPTLGLDASVEELIAGEATIGRLAAGTAGEIGAGTAPVVAGQAAIGDGSEGGAIPAESEEAPTEAAVPSPPVPDDDEVIEAEIVSDGGFAWGEAEKAKALWDEHSPRARELAAKAWGTGPDAEEAWKQATVALTDGRVTSPRNMNAEEWADMLVYLEAQVGGGGESSSPDGAAVAPSGAPPAALSDCTTGPQKAGALKRARRLAQERGEDPPASFDEISPELAGLVAKELAA